MIVMLVFAAVFAFTPSRAMADKFKVGMVTDMGGLGDQSFNDMAWDGLNMLEDEFGSENVEINVIESNNMTEYEPNLRSLADQGYDMVWAVGFLMTDALAKVAPQYPNTTFGIIDAVVEAPNVASVTFKEHQGSYLVGLIAGMKTETDTVGFIGGMETPLIKKFEAGYRAGVKEVNPKAEVKIGYTGTWDDPQTGKELAFTQINQNADVVYHAAGACGIGVINGAKEKDKYAIGVDKPQNHLAPEHVLTSMVKRVDVAVFKSAKSLYNDDFEPGHIEYGLKDNGVGISDHAAEMLSDNMLNRVNAYKEQIISGEIEVPAHPDEM